MQRDAVRGRGPRWQGDHRAQHAAAEQPGPDPAPRPAGGDTGRQQQHGRPAGRQTAQRVLRPGELRLGAGRQAVRPAGVGGEFLVSPVALVERRVAQHHVGADLGMGIGAQRVPGPDVHLPGGLTPRRVPGEQDPYGGQRRLGRIDVLAEQFQRDDRGGRVHRAGPLPGGGEQETAGAARGVEHGADVTGLAVARQLGDLGHQRRQRVRRDADLPDVRVEPAAEQEVEGLPGPVFSRQADRALHQGPLGVGEAGVVRKSLGGIGVRRTTRGCRVRRVPRPLPGEPGTGRGDRPPHRVAVPERLELRPQPFPAADLVELPLPPQPLLHLRQCELRAGVRTADRRGEAVVTAAPVADGRAPDTGDPGYFRQGDGDGRLARRRHCVSSG